MAKRRGTRNKKANGNHDNVKGKSNIKYSIVIPLAPDRKAEIVAHIKKQVIIPKKDYEIIIVPGLNVPRNRNEGIRKARGKYICFLDDDGYIEPEYLWYLDRFLAVHPEIDVCGGPQLTPPDDTYFAKKSGEVLSSNIVMPGVSRRYKSCPETLQADSSYLSGANLIAKRSIFKDKLMFFNENIYPADDVKFVEKAKEHGLVVAYSPFIKIYHRRRPTARGLYKQIFDYAVAGVKHNIRKDWKRFIFLIPMFFVLYILSLPFWAVAMAYCPEIWASLYLLPLFLYILLGIALSFRDKETNLLFLPIMTLIHFAYGLGVMSVYAEKISDIIKGILSIPLVLLFLLTFLIQKKYFDEIKEML